MRDDIENGSIDLASDEYVHYRLLNNESQVELNHVKKSEMKERKGKQCKTQDSDIII